MREEPLLAGITGGTIETARLKMRLLTGGPEGGEPVMLVHGNISSSRFWEELMLALSERGYRVFAPDLRGYGETEALTIDATRGPRDWSDDLKALADALGLRRFHLAGWSMGGAVAMQYAIDHASDLLSLTLLAAISPFGVGGTIDERGTPAYPDYAGSGGGRVNPELVRRIREGDRWTDSPFSPRNVMNNFYFKPPFRVAPEREEVFVSAMLRTKTGDDHFPGDSISSPNWPGVTPGTRGAYNAFSPRYCDLGGFAGIAPKPPVLWVRGAGDQIVADASPFDAAVLGARGLLPGWPGAEIFPPQPMVAQLRHVLDRYRAAGGRYREELLPDCGHSPHIEKAGEFEALFLEHLELASGR